MFNLIILDEALKDLKKMDPFEARKILVYMRHNLDQISDPTSIGKALVDLDPKNWRYRVGKLRILCEIDYNKKIIYVHAVINRSKAYLR